MKDGIMSQESGKCMGKSKKKKNDYIKTMTIEMKYSNNNI